MKDLGPNAKLIGVAGARSRLSTPSLLLDIEALDRNIAAMAEHVKARGLKLRPHTQGGKSIEIARRQVAAGAVGVCCSTLGEAEVMAGSGIEGVLITSPVVTPPMLERAPHGAQCQDQEPHGGRRQSGQRCFARCGGTAGEESSGRHRRV